MKSLAHIPKLQVVLAKVFQLCCPSFVDGECIKLMVHNVCVGTNTTESQLMDTLFLLEVYMHICGFDKKSYFVLTYSTYMYALYM